MIKINLVEEAVNHKRCQIISRKFRNEIEGQSIVSKFREWLGSIDEPEDKSAIGEVRGKRWTDKFPDGTGDDWYLRDSRNQIRIILAIFNVLIENNLFPKEGRSLSDEEREGIIKKLSEILPKRLLAKDGQREYDPDEFMLSSFGTARALILNENLVEIRNEIVRAEERMDKLTELGLEALKV